MSGIWHHAGCCCCIPVPDPCPCDQTEWNALFGSGTPCNGLVKFYRIKDYSDGDIPLTSCGSCGLPGPGTPVWNGQFDARGSGRCTWFYFRVDSRIPKIDEKLLELAIPAITLSAGTKWLIDIRCDHFPSGGSTSVWAGEKLCGVTPVGKYDRTGGCAATPSTLEIEEFIP